MALIHLMHNSEEALVVRNFEGRTIRQLFEAAVSDSRLGRFNMERVTLQCNMKQIGGLDSYVDDVIAGLMREPGAPANPEDLEVFVVATEQTGTKASAVAVATQADAESIRDSLQDEGWELNEDDSSVTTRTFAFDNDGDRETINVSLADLRRLGDAGTSELAAWALLQERLEAAESGEADETTQSFSPASPEAGASAGATATTAPASTYTVQSAKDALRRLESDGWSLTVKTGQPVVVANDRRSGRKEDIYIGKDEISRYNGEVIGSSKLIGALILTDKLASEAPAAPAPTAAASAPSSTPTPGGTTLDLGGKVTGFTVDLANGKIHFQIG